MAAGLDLFTGGDAFSVIRPAGHVAGVEPWSPYPQVAPSRSQGSEIAVAGDNILSQ